MKNNMLNFGLIFETALAAVFTWTPLNIVLDSRPLQWYHFGFPSLPFFM